MLESERERLWIVFDDQLDSEVPLDRFSLCYKILHTVPPAATSKSLAGSSLVSWCKDCERQLVLSFFFHRKSEARGPMSGGRCEATSKGRRRKIRPKWWEIEQNRGLCKRWPRARASCVREAGIKTRVVSKQSGHKSIAFSIRPLLLPSQRRAGKRGRRLATARFTLQTNWLAASCSGGPAKCLVRGDLAAR